MKFLKNFICLFLSMRFLVAHAEDYNFMQKAQGLIKFENSIMVPKEVLSLYHINLYSYVNYINTLEFMIESSFSDLTNTYNSYISSQKEIQNFIKNDGTSPSLETLQKLVQYQGKSKFDLYSVENKVNNLQLVYEKINSSRNILDDYCQNTSALQDPSYFSLNTQNNYFNIPLHSNYTHYSNEESFAKDPHANAVGWLTFSVLAIAGIAAFCIATSTALTTLAVITVTGVTVSGPAAVIVIAAAIVAYIAIDWYTSDENERKQREAEEHTRALREAMLAASNWYTANSIFFQPLAFKQVALDICQNQKTWKIELMYDDLDSAIQAKLIPAKCSTKYVGGEGRDSIYKKVCEVDEENQVDKTTRNLQSYFNAFDTIAYPGKIQSLKDNVTENESNIEEVIVQYKNALTTKYTKEIIQSTQEKALSNSRLAQAIDVYNIEIKENIHQKLVSDYIGNISNCRKLNFVINKDLNVLDSTANEIITNYSDELNKDNAFFTTDLPEYISQYKNTYLNNVDACNENSMFAGKARSFALASFATTLQDKIYDIQVPISFSYKDKVTDYSFSFVLANSDSLKYLQDGIFSYGLIGYFNTRYKANGGDTTVAANISALELDKISSALYAQSNLNMPKAPTNISHLRNVTTMSRSTATNSPFNTLLKSKVKSDADKTFENLSSEIDTLQNELNSSLTQENLNHYLSLNTKINAFKQVNSFNFSEFDKVLTKFNLLKSRFFYDDLFIADRNTKKAPLLFFSSVQTTEGQALRDMTNLCVASASCTEQDNMLSYLVFIDHYNPSAIFNLYTNFKDYLNNKNPDSLAQLTILFKKELSKSTAFQAEKTMISGKAPFIKDELQNSANVLVQKYAIQIKDYSAVMFSTFQNSMDL